MMIISLLCKITAFLL